MSFCFLVSYRTPAAAASTDFRDLLFHPRFYTVPGSSLFSSLGMKTAGALSLQELRTRRFFHFIIISGEEALEDAVLRLLLGQTERFELQKLVASDAADRRFVDELRVEIVCRDLRHGADLRLVHDD